MPTITDYFKNQLMGSRRQHWLRKPPGDGEEEILHQSGEDCIYIIICDHTPWC